MKLLRIIMALCLLSGAALAQTSSAIVQITVTPALVPATVTAIPSATSVAVGGAVSVAVKVAGASGAATPAGSVELLATIPGSTTKTLINTFTLVGGAFTCSYAVPATAPVGPYQLEFAYGGDANYKGSPDFQ